MVPSRQFERLAMRTLGVVPGVVRGLGRILSGAAAEERVWRQRRQLVLRCLRKRLGPLEIRSIEKELSYAPNGDWSELFRRFRTIASSLEAASSEDSSARGRIEDAEQQAHAARKRYGHLLDVCDWLEVFRHIAYARPTGLTPDPC
jgi:hypothetical protein